MELVLQNGQLLKEDCNLFDKKKLAYDVFF